MIEWVNYDASKNRELRVLTKKSYLQHSWKIEVLKSASSRKWDIYPSRRSQQTFLPKGQKRYKRLGRGDISPEFDFSRIAIPFAADSLAPFQFRPTDQTSTCGRRSIWLAKQAEARRGEATVDALCHPRRRRRPSVAPRRIASSLAGAIVTVVQRLAGDGDKGARVQAAPSSTTRLGKSSRSL